MAKFEKGNPGKKKGTTNMITRTVRETVLAVFNDLQEHPTAKLSAWAATEPTEFYKIASKLIPTDIKADIKATQKISLQIVRTNNSTPVSDITSEPAEGAE